MSLRSLMGWYENRPTALGILNKVLRPLTGRALAHEVVDGDDTWHPWWHGQHKARWFIAPVERPLLARALDAFATWALSKNALGEYADGDDRWAYTIKTGNDAYMTRVRFLRVLGLDVMLHKIHRQDLDRHLHSHPWAWAFSFLLTGSYDETRLDVESHELLRRLGYRKDLGRDPVIKRRVRWFNLLTEGDYHKIDRLHGEVWTLFVTGQRIQDWGFLVDGNHVPRREYLARHEPPITSPIEDEVADATAREKAEDERYDHNNGWCDADCSLCKPSTGT